MLTKKTWEEFRSTGLLWWINQTLHLFGWAIVVNYDDDDNITDAYPARTNFRGFSDDIVDEGFKKLTQYLVDNSPTLLKEVIEE